MTDSNAHRIHPEALQEIVEGTSAETGEGFLASLVKHLARAIGTKCSWVTEWIADDRLLRARSVCQMANDGVSRFRQKHSAQIKAGSEVTRRCVIAGGGEAGESG